MEKAILVSSAKCIGSGSDRFKSISGLTKDVLAQIPEGMTVLVPSNTQYKNQKYKKAVKWAKGWNHRQINDADYEIIKTI